MTIRLGEYTITLRSDGTRAELSHNGHDGRPAWRLIVATWSATLDQYWNVSIDDYDPTLRSGGR